MVMLGDLASKGVLAGSTTELPYYIRVALLLSLDYRLGRTCLETIGTCIAQLCDALKRSNDWETLSTDIIEHMLDTTKQDVFEQHHILEALKWAAATSPAAWELRLRLATSFVEQHGSEEPCSDCRTGKADTSHRLKCIWNAMQRDEFSASRFKQSGLPEDYVKMTMAVKILGIALGSVDDLQKDKKMANEIAKRLRLIFGNIADPRASYIERSEAKHELVTLSSWIRLVAPITDSDTQTRLPFTKKEPMEPPLAIQTEPSMAPDMSSKE
ncbi:uncharacterized protein EV422DRAFT_314790 [Fimicolochytrium jonesii]|uniref:uncharacterized protein n=1 Tax=Fimicolochytrium jonesii TaxID=1396493 RepID=UPI0022FE295D|nr:uncharacterized protein EV422DRAFT_314790 [Fimicolochytrium jonesii]KAI8824277.1 hypothetical protein EV422DRAFT_314790 [Fimicolochytrium jonesii]